jgi:2,4-dienoyl-CoA reductase-like NADH-dependent reductase (Old Yellow Enzyme family)
MPYTKLFSPVQFGTLTVPNRLQRTSQVSGLATEDGHVTPELTRRYQREAQGGVGSLVVEAAVVNPSRSSYNLRISDDSLVPELTEMVTDIRQHNPRTKIGLQIMHFLKISKSGWRQRVSDFNVEELPIVIDQHVQGARRAVEAGFDFIELHMAHAYTLSSFLSLSNDRTDGYGGSLSNRMRLPIAVYQAVRQQVGDSYPLGIRINGEDFTLKGTTLLHSTQIAKRLAELGADYLSVSGGSRFDDSPPPAPGNPPDPMTGYSGHRMSPASWFPDLTNVYLAEAIREEVRKAGFQVPIITAGKIRNPDQAEKALEEEKADVIGLCRALLCDPDWPSKAMDDRAQEIVTCSACNWCLEADTRMEKVNCVRWPEGALNAPTPWLPKQSRHNAHSDEAVSSAGA